MNKLTTSDKIYIKKSNIPDGGRGVFAKVDIKKGEMVEKSPIIEIPEHEISYLAKSSLATYIFFFGKAKSRTDESDSSGARDKKRAAFLLGFGSIYNHSDTPNAIHKIKPKDKVIEFTALKNIPKDTEVTFNYRGSDSSKAKLPLWFEGNKS